MSTDYFKIGDTVSVNNYPGYTIEAVILNINCQDAPGKNLIASLMWIACNNVLLSMTLPTGVSVITITPISALKKL
jgi:hypothetical protein